MVEDIPTFNDSEESLELPDAPSSKSGAKRRASRAGTRSVASLTPEQLARKRANDREAQRSIRQRTKNHIEELEQRIRELSGDGELQSIDDVRRRNAELEVELRYLKETVGRPEGSVISSPELVPLSSRYGTDMIDSPYSYSPRWSSPGTSSLSSSPYTVSSAGELISSLAPDYSSLGSNMPIGEMSGPPPQVASPANRRGIPFNPRPHFGRSRSYPNGRLGQPWQPTSSSMSNPAIVRMPLLPMLNQPIPSASNPSGFDGSISAMSLPLSSYHMAPTSNPLGMNGSMVEMAAPMPRQAQSGIRNETIPEVVSPITREPQQIPSTDGQKPDISSFIPSQGSGAIHDGLPAFAPRQTFELPFRFVPPTCPVDSIMIGLLQRQKNLGLSGTTAATAIGPYHPNLRGLVNMENSPSTHPIATVLADLISRTQLKGLAEKSAALYVIYRLTQWQLSPTAETYNNLPDWYGPRASQLLTSHPLWTTMIAWGKLRDIVINDQEKYATEEFQLLYNCSMNVNWPYRNQEILVFEGDEVRATDAFTRHVWNHANWTLDEPFQRRYPELEHACRFSEVPMQQQHPHSAMNANH